MDLKIQKKKKKRCDIRYLGGRVREKDANFEISTAKTIEFYLELDKLKVGPNSFLHRIDDVRV